MYCVGGVFCGLFEFFFFLIFCCLLIGFNKKICMWFLFDFGSVQFLMHWICFQCLREIFFLMIIVGSLALEIEFDVMLLRWILFCLFFFVVVVNLCGAWSLFVCFFRFDSIRMNDGGKGVWSIKILINKMCFYCFLCGMMNPIFI